MMRKIKAILLILKSRSYVVLGDSVLMDFDLHEWNALTHHKGIIHNVKINAQMDEVKFKQCQSYGRHGRGDNVVELKR